MNYKERKKKKCSCIRSCDHELFYHLAFIYDLDNYKHFSV